jgi:hypothetical protein
VLSLLRLDCFEAKSNVINDTCAIDVQLLLQGLHNLLPNLQTPLDSSVHISHQHVQYESGLKGLTQPSAISVKLTCCFLASGTMLKYLAAKVSSQPVMSVGMAVGRGTSSQLCTLKPAASSRLCVVGADEKFQGLPAL